MSDPTVDYRVPDHVLYTPGVGQYHVCTWYTHGVGQYHVLYTHGVGQYHVLYTPGASHTMCWTVFHVPYRVPYHVLGTLLRSILRDGVTVASRTAY